MLSLDSPVSVISRRMGVAGWRGAISLHFTAWTVRLLVVMMRMIRLLGEEGRGWMHASHMTGTETAQRRCMHRRSLRSVCSICSLAPCAPHPP